MNIFEQLGQKIESLVDQTVTWVNQQTCRHRTYRPALVKGNPGRICTDCKMPERISEVAFYAQFGEKTMAEVKRRQEKRGQK
jgi:hypothetical protein